MMSIGIRFVFYVLVHFYVAVVVSFHFLTSHFVLLTDTCSGREKRRREEERGEKNEKKKRHLPSIYSLLVSSTTDTINQSSINHLLLYQ